MKKKKFIITPVNALPKKDDNRTDKHNMIEVLERFLNSPHDIVKIELSFDDYKNIDTAANSFGNSICKHKYPFKVVVRNGGLYLVKKKF